MNKIAGVDEVGRGPLAGAVVAAAVILDPDDPIDGLMDSKKLSVKRREYLSDQIKQKAIAWHIATVDAALIDELNIHHATLLAMKQAIEGLSIVPDSVLVDGKFCPNIMLPCDAIVKGDTIEPSISAASIIAKVARDQAMIALDAVYPGYGFAKHKGYPTKQHLLALEQLGVSAIHRCSYAPVKNQLS